MLGDVNGGGEGINPLESRTGLSRFDIRHSPFDNPLMRSGMMPGIVREVCIVVTPDMCPAFDGVVVHRVYSTWSAAHHFEIAARKVLVDFLEAHEEGIGSHLSIDHLAPCPLGRTVRVRAELMEVTNEHHPRVVCQVEAYDGDRLLARGRQVQVVMNKEHVQRYIARS